ncbi:hypothetical protein KMW28_26810 [Flammeovirga yaeyamensis]|uniref:Bacteriocin-type signal sequence n=1 Tax=Flammeovirga yaeyamensis TaxID=367791 RepID=A0AAX1NDI4_9BACT|nr:MULTISPECIES: hypothetical protein [Flammeovirga]ANQ52274.1 hypothetical protein MY04_4939 [Flammeovirga sp. MY04]MBB3701407.1 hypothetical protein [Flammeovirga yaeyamensis]NMF38635.1 hypothetical protein [Flammeovirga yaeyamensis]QWG04511.1 hypothetical protein KMW28_26810 [Flammeovirga yaeyamensis]
MEESKKKVNLTFTVEELQLIIGGLGKLPFEKVYQLIGRINAESNLQLVEGTQKEEIENK